MTKIEIMLGRLSKCLKLGRGHDKLAVSTDAFYENKTGVITCFLIKFTTVNSLMVNGKVVIK